MYVIKALVGWVLPPGLLILAAALLAVWAHKCQQRRLATALMGFAVVFYLCCIPAVADGLMRGLEQSVPHPSAVHGDVLVMLGGGATPDTPDVDGVGMLSSSAESRLFTTLRLYRETKLPIVLSGGQVYPDDGVEADIARRQLISMGVPAADIYVEDKSRNTEENAKYTRKILAEHHFQHPVLITSAFHMRRAVLDFAKEGVGVEAYPCDYQTSAKPKWYVNQFVPSGQAMDLTWTVLHEYLGIVQAAI
jgi:uncharacterized SAM-binding protein YcdF (DUF218 family)